MVKGCFDAHRSPQGMFHFVCCMTCFVYILEKMIPSPLVAFLIVEYTCDWMLLLGMDNFRK